MMFRGEPGIAAIFVELERCNLLPAILFRTARNQCDLDVQRASRNRRMFLSSRDQQEIREEIEAIISKYELDRELIISHPQFASLTLTGIGAHHAGQLLMWRLLLEELMAAGMLRILIATGTVAAGVDFPARTVVITAHSKRGAAGFNVLSSSEFQQMSGRAGRRGRDAVGFCIVAPAPFCDARELYKVSGRPPEPLVSAYYPSPSTVLNLLRYRNVDDLRFTVQRSLASFLDKKEAQKLREESEYLVRELGRDGYKVTEEILIESNESLPREVKKRTKKIRRTIKAAEELEGRQVAMLDKTLTGLSELGYMDGFKLSEKGYWASNLCTSLVLELAEVINRELLTGASRERLVAIVAALSSDSHRRYLEPKDSMLSDEDISALENIIASVAAQAIPGVQESREVSESAAYTALYWMHCENWQEFRGILMLSGVTEGDAARLITQTADHLNQISRLSESHQQLAYLAQGARLHLLRPPLTEAINLET